MSARRLVPLLVLLLAASGCAKATIYPYGGVTYVAPEGVQIDRVVLLPTNAGPGLQEYRRVADDSLYSAIRQLRPDLDIISASECTRALGEEGLMDKLVELLATYERTGVSNGDLLAELGAALQAGHFLYVDLKYAQVSSKEWRLLEGLHTAEHQNLELVGRLWEASEGKLVWESSVGAKASAGKDVFVTTLSRDLPDMIGVVAVSLASSFPR